MFLYIIVSYITLYFYIKHQGEVFFYFISIFLYTLYSKVLHVLVRKFKVSVSEIFDILGCFKMVYQSKVPAL